MRHYHLSESDTDDNDHAAGHLVMQPHWTESWTPAQRRERHDRAPASPSTLRSIEPSPSRS
jgi:hypothetical protein